MFDSTELHCIINSMCHKFYNSVSTKHGKKALTNLHIDFTQELRDNMLPFQKISDAVE